MGGAWLFKVPLELPKREAQLTTLFCEQRPKKKKNKKNQTCGVKTLIFKIFLSKVQLSLSQYLPK